MNTARFLMPIFTLHDFLYLLLDFLLAGLSNPAANVLLLLLYTRHGRSAQTPCDVPRRFCRLCGPT